MLVVGNVLELWQAQLGLHCWLTACVVVEDHHHPRRAPACTIVIEAPIRHQVSYMRSKFIFVISMIRLTNPMKSQIELPTYSSITGFGHPINKHKPAEAQTASNLMITNSVQPFLSTATRPHGKLLLNWMPQWRAILRDNEQPELWTTNQRWRHSRKD